MEQAVSFEAHGSYITGLKFTNEGQRLFSAGMDNIVKLWSIHDWALVRAFEGHTKSVNGLALTPDETTLVTGSSDCTVRVWDVRSGDVRHVLQDRKRVVSALTLSPDGAWVAAGSYKGRAAVWTIDGQPVVSFPASKSNLASACFSPVDPGILVTSGLGPVVAVWEIPTGRQLTSLTVDAAAVMPLRFTPDGKHLIALTYEGAVHTWTTGDWQTTDQTPPAVPGARAFSIDAAGRRIAILSAGHVQIRSYPDWTILTELSVDANVLTASAFSPSGDYLVVGAADRKLRGWDLSDAS